MTADLKQLSHLIRYYILKSTTAAGSGHPTSSLSAVELMAVLFFDGFLQYDLEDPDYFNNDRVIFSKGHASPLLYALYAAAGKVSLQELKTLRQFESDLEGHPTMRFQYTEAATGSLGQGLSIGVGMALNGKYLDQLPYITYVLLGDSEMAEGSVWEAIQLASYYQLDNLVGIIDVNRLGQRGETMYGHQLEAFEHKLTGFGWETIMIDGHDIAAVKEGFSQARALQGGGKPVMIIAQTIKGKGVSFLENAPDWHGKTLSDDQLQRALTEIGEVDEQWRGEIAVPERPESIFDAPPEHSSKQTDGSQHQSLLFDTSSLATRKAYGEALSVLGQQNQNVVVLDAEVSNSTYAQVFKASNPDRFFEMFIAEQNMVGVGVGLALRGKTPFISTFAAFFTRAFDQIRMARYSQASLNFVGSHAGVSIGEDGGSQMGLEDIAMFRTIPDSIVLYPSDAVSTAKLVPLLSEHSGISYLRTTRMDTPILYDSNEQFYVGGSKTLRTSSNDQVTVIGAGVTVFEALSAYKLLQDEGIIIRVIDLYSIKPLDGKALLKAARETRAILTVEDHYPAGGIGEAVNSFLSTQEVPVYSLAVQKLPRSGKPEELLHYESIDAEAIVDQVRMIVN